MISKKTFAVPEATARNRMELALEKLFLFRMLISGICSPHVDVEMFEIAMRGSKAGILLKFNLNSQRIVGTGDPIRGGG
jgi:hypothetical protein